jgi:signal transduction histidine kinase
VGSLISLLALVAWWTVLLSRSLDQTYRLKLADLVGAAAELTSVERLALESWYERRQLMVFGEGGLLVIVTAICCLMLVRLAAEQRRYKEQLDAFVGQATHEMKTPLSGLRALLQTIQLGRLPAEQLSDAVSLGLGQIARQERLIQNLLMGHRVRFFEGDFACRLTSVAPLVEVLLRERTGVGDRGCAFELNAPEQSEALADSEALQTILENLFENAVLYGAKSVQVTVVQEGQWLEISVKDDGEGFATDRSEAIFEPYMRASSDTRGTGLGLPLSRSLAQAMGGQLTGHSAGKGMGATFTVRLNAAPGEST